MTHDELREQVAREVYAKRPMKAISRALADMAGVNIGDPIPWDVVVAGGGSHFGLLQIVGDTIEVIQSHYDALREALEEMVGSTMGGKVAGGDGNTYAIYPPTVNALAKARAALEKSNG